MTTTITHVRVFDGDHVLQDQTVVLDGHVIVSSAGEPGPAAGSGDVVDGHGATVLPGLIDAHVHTSLDGLRNALRFGVTTELEMQGRWSAQERQRVADNDEVADVRSAGWGLTAPGGHPSELFPGDGPPPGVVLEGRDSAGPPSVSSPEQAAALVAELVADGSDYIKIMIEEGSVLGAPGLPMLTDETVRTAVAEAHRHQRMALAHALTVQTALQAVAAGVDGLTHLFLDQPHTPGTVAAIASSGAFVTPCLVLNSSIMGGSGTALAADPRVGARLTPDWHATLCGSFDTYPHGRFEDVLASVAALHAAGVDILVGTDVSVALPFLGGLAHGASVHHELQLLVQAGLTPVQALRAATSVPARRFGLHDRGRVRAGGRADLLLVDGDPTADISDSLNIREVWRRGVRQVSR